jgi:hypothetical protein
LVIINQNSTKISGGSHLAECRVDHWLGKPGDIHVCCSFFGANFDHMPLGRHDATWASQFCEDSSLAMANHGWVTLSGFENPCWHLHGCYIYSIINIYIVNGVNGI